MTWSGAQQAHPWWLFGAEANRRIHAILHDEEGAFARELEQALNASGLMS